MSNELIELWRHCDLTRTALYHHADEPYLRREFGESFNVNPNNFDEFLQSERFGTFDDSKFHLSLMPVPYQGDLKNADIFILLLNPGFEYADYWAETHSQEFRHRLKNNLTQQFEGIDFPFLCLDPQFCWHPGFRWWERKLRAVISRIAEEKFRDSKTPYLDALRSMSQRLAAIELVPYHSQSFRAHSLLRKLPSADAAKRYVREVLVPAADRGDKTIIVTRRVSDWALIKGTHVVHYEGALARGASLSPKSDGGKAILRRYEISC